MLRRPRDILIPVLLVLGNLLILGPHLISEFSSRAWNAEYKSIGLARIFYEQHFTWNPLWYGGIPFHHADLPLFHAAVALLAWLIPGISAANAYHLVSALAYAAVPVTLYFLVQHLFESRPWAAAAAVAYSVLPSPLYLLAAPGALAARYGRAPWPFIALLEYGDGPHLAATAMLPLALLAAWRAQQEFRFLHYALASFAAAFILLTSRQGAMGLATGLAAVAVAHVPRVGYRTAILRTLAILATALVVSAFWLTPGFVVTTSVLVYVRRLAQQVLLAQVSVANLATLAMACILLRLAVWERRIPRNIGFLLAWVALAGCAVSLFAPVGDDPLAERWRYGLPLHLALAVALGGLLALLPEPLWHWRMAIAAMALTLAASHLFLRTAWRYQPRADARATLFYQIADWLARQPPGRVFVSGEPAGTLNVFRDIPQASGGSEQGASNPLIVAAHREAALGSCDSAQRARRLAEMWARALGCRYVLAHSAASREYYHAYVFPERFAGLAELWSNGRGDLIYGVPGAGDGAVGAVVVDLAAMRRLAPLRSTEDANALAAYVAWAEGKRAARVAWTRHDRARLVENLARGEAILIKTNYDPGWDERHRNFRLSADPIGFLLLEPGRSGMLSGELGYRGAWDLWLGRGLAAVFALVLLLGGVPPLRLGLGLGVVWLALLGVWAWREAPRLMGQRIVVAHEAFRRIQPPLIAPGGIVDAETYQQPPLRIGRPVTILGRNFGGSGQGLRVLADGREARLLSRSGHKVTMELPPLSGSQRVEIAVEVNGCRGNAFVVEVE